MLIQTFIIALYVIPIQYTGQPLTKFLCDYFIWFDSWFSLFGTISVAVFSMYLLFAVMKGTFKFGMRFFLLPIHPMKPGGTLMNSMLFNLILILLCAIPCAQFCSQAFRDYARLTDIDVIFTGQIAYMDGFVYFYQYNIFIYALVFFSLM
jgi:LMBR1 domain-containing protein 1